MCVVGFSAGGLILQTRFQTAPPSCTPTDQPPPRAPRSTSWVSTLCLAVQTPSTALWLPIPHQAPPCRDVLVKQALRWPDTHPQPANPPVLWLAATSKQHQVGSLKAPWWVVAQWEVAKAHQTRWAPPPVREAPSHLPRPPSPSHPSSLKRGTCPAGTPREQTTRSWPLSVGVAHPTWPTHSPMSPSPSTVRCNAMSPASTQEKIEN